MEINHYKDKVMRTIYQDHELTTAKIEGLQPTMNGSLRKHVILCASRIGSSL